MRGLDLVLGFISVMPPTSGKEHPDLGRRVFLDSFLPCKSAISLTAHEFVTYRPVYRREVNYCDLR